MTNQQKVREVKKGLYKRRARLTKVIARYKNKEQYLFDLILVTRCQTAISFYQSELIQVLHFLDILEC